MLARLVEVPIVFLDCFLQELHKPPVEGFEPLQGGFGQVLKNEEEVPASFHLHWFARYMLVVGSQGLENGPKKRYL